jgi:ABC-type amino acid transport substrate-binding protein
MASRTAATLAGIALLAAGPAAAAEPGLPTTLRVLVAAQEQPEMYSFAASGPGGIERDLVEGFCRLHGMKLETIAVQQFEQIIPMLQRGEGDMIAGIVDTPERRDKVAFTSEIFPVRHLAVTFKPRGPVGVEELRTLRVGVVPGTSWEKAVVEAGVPEARRVTFPTSNELLAALRSGKIDAMTMGVIDFALAQKRTPELVAGAFLGATTGAGFAVRKEDSRLLGAFDAYLQDSRQGRQALMLRYLSQDALGLIARARRP